MYCKNCGNKLVDGSKFCDKCGMPTDSLIQKDGSKIETELILPASNLRRLSNHIIDSIIVYILLFICIFLGETFDSSFFNILGFILYFIGYYVICESIWGRTIGKLITKTKVVDRQGNKPNFLKILGRSFARYIPFEPLSFLVGGFPIGWHDSLSKTYVVSKGLKKEDVKKIDVNEIKKQNSNKVVTTILIVVIGGLFFIAVIGILSSVVLASLNSARSKGADAAIKSNLASARAQAELYYDGAGQSYTGVCDDFLDGVASTKASLSKLSPSSVICNDSKTAWAMSAELKAGDYWCVDSTGESSLIDNDLGNSVSCLKFDEDSAINDLIFRVGKLIELPTGEEPVVATINDAAALIKDQVFYKGAKNGDVVLVYKKAAKAIVYSPDTNTIINVGPIYLNN